jgi:hypothetical protein
MKDHTAFLLCFLVGSLAHSLAANSHDTFPPLQNDNVPGDLEQMWGDFDPRAEPLETEVLAEWEEENVVLRVVRFRVGIFKGRKSTLAAVYGFPKGQKNLPGLLQIHGGGQYADAKACIANAHRGYATVSIAWAGRISSSKYRVNPARVQLFWDANTDDPEYRPTTDWGAVDGYHAPGRNQGSQFPSVAPHPWTLDAVKSPRNSGWFLCAVAARRALSFLEQQPEVDRDRLGVYGHSMGGKLTVLASVDKRVKAAAPSCGGISDRYNDNALFRATLGDDVSLKAITCPIIFLSPANDFHGRIVNLPAAVNEIQSDQWRLTCSPQHSHQDTPPYEVATMLWFDQHLQATFTMPSTPRANLQLGEVPALSFTIDSSMPVDSVDVYYSQHGKEDETPSDRELTTNRFWHHVSPTENDGRWLAELPISSIDAPLLAYANVTYRLPQPVSGAGYYYRTYTADTFNLSSLVSLAWADQVARSDAKATLQSTRTIETFDGEWRKEWFSYRPDRWAITTHKLNDAKYAAPTRLQDQTGKTVLPKLTINIRSQQPNQLVLLVENKDSYAAVLDLPGGSDSHTHVVSLSDFKNHAGEELKRWSGGRRLKLSPAEHLKAPRGQSVEPRRVGGNWNGPPPQFDNLQWKQTLD